MNVFEQLSNNYGAIPSALSKTLAQSILNGQTHILLDCIDLVSSDPTVPALAHVRSGAARVVAIVALNRPDMVSPYLRKLMPALAARESQTRWLVIRSMGFCAHLNKLAAQSAVAYAEEFIEHKEGLALASATDLFLGDFGAISREAAQKAFSILERSMTSVIPNEQDCILEALFRMFPNLGTPERERCFAFAKDWQHSTRKSTQQKAKRILRLRR